MTPRISRTRQTSSRSSSTSTHTPAERGNTTWSPDVPDFKMPVKPGDHVVFPRSAGVWVEVEDERLLVCRVREILGVIEEDKST